MKLWFYAFFMAWGMFLALPCPFPRWDEAARERMLVMLPLVGAIVGALWALAAFAVRALRFPAPVAALVLAALPWLLTGFIHLDGFSDVSDAILSRRDLPTRRRILKDPHCGAFGVIGLLLLILAQFCVFLSGAGAIAPAAEGAADSVREGALRFGLAASPRFAFLLSLALIPVSTRACAGLAVLSLRAMETSQYASLSSEAVPAEEAPAVELRTEGVEDLSVPVKAKKSGKKTGKKSGGKAERSGRPAHFAALGVMLAVSVLAPVLLFGLSGLAPAAAGCCYWLCALGAYKNLGGMNGDISGFALSLAELAGACVLVFVK